MFSRNAMKVSPKMIIYYSSRLNCCDKDDGLAFFAPNRTVNSYFWLASILSHMVFQGSSSRLCPHIVKGQGLNLWKKESEQKRPSCHPSLMTDLTPSCGIYLIGWRREYPEMGRNNTLRITHSESLIPRDQVLPSQHRSPTCFIHLPKQMKSYMFHQGHQRHNTHQAVQQLDLLLLIPSLLTVYGSIRLAPQKLYVCFCSQCTRL